MATNVVSMSTSMAYTSTNWAAPRPVIPVAEAPGASSDHPSTYASEAGRQSQQGILHLLDLRFADAEQEKFYKDSLRHDVLQGTLLSFGSFIAGVIAAILPAIAREAARTDNPLGQGFDVRMAVIVTWSLNLIMLSSFFLIGLGAFFKGWFSWLNWESVFVTVASFFNLSLAMANFWHMPQLVGQDPKSVWSHDVSGSDMFVLLAMDGIMTLVAMYVPIRSCVLWLPFLCGVLPYLLNTIVFYSVFEDTHMMVLAVLGLGTMAYHGALRREVTHRQKWMAENRVVAAEVSMRKKDFTIEETTAQVKGLRGVAEALCDVILKLGSDLRVHGADLQHDAFFEQRVEGTLFDDLLAEPDRGRFRQMLTASKTGVPLCLPATIQKNQITCEVHLLVVDTGERREPRFLVGIRVETEQYSGLDSSEAARLQVADGLKNRNEKQDWEEDSVGSFHTQARMAEKVPPPPTPVRSRALCIKKLLPRWNIPRDANSCCQYHTVVNSIVDAVELLSRTKCEPLWASFGSGQCTRCQCMYNREQKRCVVCGHTFEGGHPSGSQDLGQGLLS
mmetsp:Transcript_56925/g.133536  ORF Transcript_56925/g.133536 Transcript_56925/m.133536 type:complete len:560 (-) Transcript_56925:65-1744(-)